MRKLILNLAIPYWGECAEAAAIGSNCTDIDIWESIRGRLWGSFCGHKEGYISSGLDLELDIDSMRRLINFMERVIKDSGGVKGGEK